MKNVFVAAACAAALVVPAAASAQETIVGTTRAIKTVSGTIVTSQRLVAGAVESKITTGKPYSAEAVTDVTQTLQDGNRIERQTITRVYRDGQGRTRREQVTADGRVQSVAISDPVAHTSFTLDPEKKLAYRSGVAIVTPSGIAPAGATGGGGGGRGGAVGGVMRQAGAAGGGGGTGTGAGAGSGTGTGSGAAVAGGFGGVVGGVPGGVLPARQPGDASNQKREDLGQQTIEGVPARGTRTTTTIPAGSIGNLQEIRIVSEQWFSDDLQALVLTKHSDPRSGETVYRLRNIVRAEPDPNLFTVPADYTVEQRIVRRPQ